MLDFQISWVAFFGVSCFTETVRVFGGMLDKGTLGDIDPLNKLPVQRFISRVKKCPPLRGLPNIT